MLVINRGCDYGEEPSFAVKRRRAFGMGNYWQFKIIVSQKKLHVVYNPVFLELSKFFSVAFDVSMD